jgi:ubiquitin-conjugating enzyme E2 D/E
MLEKDPLEYCILQDLDDGDDLHTWKCTIVGPPNTPYAGGHFLLVLKFPAQYPFQPPKVQFVTKPYHPSVLQETGEVCAETIGGGSSWGPTLNARHVLSVIYQMLQEPSTDHPLEDAIAQQLATKPKEFEKQAKKQTKELAKP